MSGVRARGSVASKGKGHSSKQQSQASIKVSLKHVLSKYLFVLFRDALWGKKGSSFYACCFRLFLIIFSLECIVIQILTTCFPHAQWLLLLFPLRNHECEDHTRLFPLMEFGLATTRAGVLHCTHRLRHLFSYTSFCIW